MNMDNSVPNNPDSWQHSDSPLAANKRRIFIAYANVFVGDHTTYTLRKEVKNLVDEHFESRAKFLHGLSPKKVAEKVVDILKDGWFRANSNARIGLADLLLDFQSATARTGTGCEKTSELLEDVGSLVYEGPLANLIEDADDSESREKETIQAAVPPGEQNSSSHDKKNCNDQELRYKGQRTASPERPSKVQDPPKQYERDRHGRETSYRRKGEARYRNRHSAFHGAGRQYKRDRNHGGMDYNDALEPARKRPRNEVDIGKPFVPNLPSCDLGKYEAFYQELMLLRDTKLCNPIFQSRIMKEANEAITQACYDWCVRHHPSMLREMKWDHLVNAQLHLFHRNVTQVTVLKSTLQLQGEENVANFLWLLKRVSQVRHSAVHEDKMLPIRLIEKMLADAISLSVMVQDKENEQKLRDLKDQVAADDPWFLQGDTTRVPAVRRSLVNQITERERPEMDVRYEIARLKRQFDEINREIRSLSERLDVVDSVNRGDKCD
ncbi:hypothetical protein OCU04_011050 [Sclerotinia nivalis]|uniref:Uncharacterized protein n=1 Tax=Sclerotinia nivalis TaxID=352851 RepID=A0A9X0ADH4_9HELO|nr:hypothetical protein OCU04_011050 [Sclerotinia nivalis]